MWGWEFWAHRMDGRAADVSGVECFAHSWNSPLLHSLPYKTAFVRIRKKAGCRCIWAGADINSPTCKETAWQDRSCYSCVRSGTLPGLRIGFGLVACFLGQCGIRDRTHDSPQQLPFGILIVADNASNHCPDATWKNHVTTHKSCHHTQHQSAWS